MYYLNTFHALTVTEKSHYHVIALGRWLHELTRSSAIAEIARVGGHYAIQGHSRSLILIPIESPNATSCQ